MFICNGSPVGLTNHGNTCFFAAATQVLIAFPAIRELVAQKYHQNYCSSKPCFLCEWEDLANCMLNNRDCNLDLRPTCNAFALATPLYISDQFLSYREQLTLRKYDSILN